MSYLIRQRKYVAIYLMIRIYLSIDEIDNNNNNNTSGYGAYKVSTY